VLRTLIQPRYAALSVLMVVIAAVCVSAGTWQIARYEQKASANSELRRNAHSTTDPVASVLPVYSEAPAMTRDQLEFRRITATGTYDVTGQAAVRERQVNDDTGYYILTPLHTSTGVTLLVVRGFISNDTWTATGGRIPAPPAGPVTVQGRVEPADTGSDKAAELPRGVLDSINVGDEVGRSGARTYDGYATLDDGQPGTSGLTTIPPPDLSNPAGGALEPQHLAYVIQWYLFAALALAAPFAMVRADRKRAPTELGMETTVEAPTTVEDKLADRYGRR
jgi:cytochrome oxidase assembly protein ShyY1